MRGHRPSFGRPPRDPEPTSPPATWTPHRRGHPRAAARAARGGFDDLHHALCGDRGNRLRPPGHLEIRDGPSSPATSTPRATARRPASRRPCATGAVRSHAADVLRTGALGLRTPAGPALRCRLWASRSVSPRWSRCSASATPRAGLIAQIRALGTNLLTVAEPCSVTRSFSRVHSDRHDLPDRGSPEFLRSSTSRRPANGRDRSQTGVVSPSGGPPRPARRARREAARGNLAESGDRSLPLGGARLGGRRNGSASTDLTGRGSRRSRRPRFTVIGIMNTLPNARTWIAALIGWPVADNAGLQRPSDHHLRALHRRDGGFRAVGAGGHRDPEHPDQVDVSDPSDALTARGRRVSVRLAVSRPGRGRVAGRRVGIANVMVISVLERRRRSACGARSAPPGGTSAQFLTESPRPRGVGGCGGDAAGRGGDGGLRDQRGGGSWRCLWLPWAGACWWRSWWAAGPHALAQLGCRRRMRCAPTASTPSGCASKQLRAAWRAACHANAGTWSTSG